MPLYWKNTLTCFYLHYAGYWTCRWNLVNCPLLWKLPSYHRYSRNLLWIMKSLEIIDLSQIWIMLFLKLLRKLWLYVFKTNLNQANLMNLYNQPISDFIAAKPPSLAFTTTFWLKLIIVSCLTCLLLLTVSTTIFCLKDFTLFSVFGTALDWFRSYLTNRTQFTLIDGKNHNLASAYVACPKVMSLDASCSYFTQHH